MTRQKAPEPPEDDVPAWVMTFSDVITLLMTFFILLLTFATNQPETFDRMQVAMFGGGGSSGIAGKTDGMAKDSLLMRQRARTGRMSPDGSEIPPIYSDPTLETLDKGVSGLEEKERRDLSESHRITLAWSDLLDKSGKLSSRGQQQLRMLSIQMRKRPVQLELMVSSDTSLPNGLDLAEYLTNEEAIPSSRIGVGVATHLVDDGRVLMLLDMQGTKRGS